MTVTITYTSFSLPHHRDCRFQTVCRLHSHSTFGLVSPSPLQPHLPAELTITATWPPSCATLFHILPATIICKLLTITDVLTVSSVDQAARRQILASSAVWHARLFTAFPPFPPSISNASSSSPLPWLCDVVQVIDTQWCSSMTYDLNKPHDCPPSLYNLTFCPNLRHATLDTDLLPHIHQSSYHPVPTSLIIASPSLSSMRHLNRLSLYNGPEISINNMRLLATLPLLASFAVKQMFFESGNEDTLRQWQALSGCKPQSTKKEESRPAEENRWRRRACERKREGWRIQASM